MPNPASVDEVPDQTLDRWVVNYLRHQTAHYNEITGNFKQEKTQPKTYLSLFQNVMEKISVQYPAYKDEVTRQITSKHRPIIRYHRPLKKTRKSGKITTY